MEIKIKKLEKSEVEITGVLEVSEFEKYEDKALEKIAERLEIPGFRKGRAPKSVAKENVTEMMLLEEMAEQALHKIYPEILEENKIDAIGRPQIAITKIAKGVDLEFKIATAILPEMDLPDYKKLAGEIKKKNPVAEISVDEAEVEKTILELRKMRAEQARNKNADLPSEEGDSKETKELTESDYPPFNDEFAKSFGDFENAEALKDKIKSNMKIEKETTEKDKLRLLIVEDLIKESKGEIPEILINSEIDKMLYRLEADITNMGLKFEDYLKQINKTEEDMRKEWRADAEKRAKLQVIIHSISEKENLKPKDEEIDEEVGKILSMYKEADPMRARAYVENMMENEKVFQFLENQ